MADMLRICMRKSRTPAEAIDRKDLQKPSNYAFAFVTRILGLGSIPQARQDEYERTNRCRQGFLFYYSCAYGKCSRFSGERSEPRGWGPSDGLGPSDCTKKNFRAYCYHPISEKLAWPSALSPPLLLMRGQLARTTSYDGLRSAARFLRRKAPGRHAAMLFDPPEQRCFHRSSNAERAAEQAGHLLQVTQSASSRLSSSAVQAGTTSRTTRGVVRPGLPLLRPHVQMETILYSMGVRQQSQLLLVVAVMRRPARVRMVRCSFT